MPTRTSVGSGRSSRRATPSASARAGIDIADRLVDERPVGHRSTGLEHVDARVEAAGGVELMLDPSVELDD